PAGAGAAGGAAARPAGAATAAPAAAAPDERPEADHLVVAAVIATAASLPLHVALDAGYFQQHGLTVETNILSASASVQALVAGSVQLYQGGSAAISARLAGTDIIYVAAAVDRSSLVLYGEKGLATFPDFRGKAVAPPSPG